MIAGHAPCVSIHLSNGGPLLIPHLFYACFFEVAFGLMHNYCHSSVDAAHIGNLWWKALIRDMSMIHDKWALIMFVSARGQALTARAA